MRIIKWLLPVILSVALLPLSACTSRDEAAQEEAVKASGAFNAGAYAAARVHIGKAISYRDDVPEYWRISGQISIALRDLPQAYSAYRNAIALDPSDVDSLRYVCALGGEIGDPGVEQFADQLLAIHPNDPPGLIVKGRMAEARGDRDGAMKYAQRILDQSPDDTGAQMLMARIYLATHQNAAAEKLLSQALKEHGNEPSLISNMIDIYRDTGDQPNYERMVARMARLVPNDWRAQLRLVDLLYAREDLGNAYALARMLMQKFPDNIELSNGLLKLWQTEGAKAVPSAAIEVDAAIMSSQMRSVYGAYANGLGKPDITLKIFAGKASGIDSNAAASAALAEALLLTGKASEAQKILDAAQKKDSGPNRTTLIAAKILVQSRQYEQALAMVRQLAAGDRTNVEAQLLQADILWRQGNKDLAVTALRDSFGNNPADVRIASRLVQMLDQTGQAGAARTVLDDMVRGDPFNRRAVLLRNGYCVRNRPQPCPISVRKGN